MANTNCLEDIRCPSCGQEDRFGIEGTAIFIVTDDGTKDQGDIDWTDTSFCRCEECDYSGTVANFRLEYFKIDPKSADEVIKVIAHIPTEGEQMVGIAPRDEIAMLHTLIYAARRLVEAKDPECNFQS